MESNNSMLSSYAQFTTGFRWFKLTQIPAVCPLHAWPHLTYIFFQGIQGYESLGKSRRKKCCTHELFRVLLLVEYMRLVVQLWRLLLQQFFPTSRIFFKLVVPPALLARLFFHYQGLNPALSDDGRCLTATPNSGLAYIQNCE